MEEDIINQNGLKNDFDVVIPNGNEQELIDRAILLGHKKLVLLSDDFNYPKKFSSLKNNKDIEIKFGIYIRNPNDIAKTKGFDYTFADAERKFFESRIDYIMDCELSDRKDSFHYKSTRLNQVHAELSKKNNQSIIFSFNNLLGTKEKNIVYGRMQQNASIAKKFSINTPVFSVATNANELRSRTILDALSNVLYNK